MRLRFTIRDLLWLTIVAALAGCNESNKQAGAARQLNLANVPFELDGDRLDMSLDEFKALHPRAKIVFEGRHSAVEKILFGIPNCFVSYDFVDNQLAVIDVAFPEQDRQKVLSELEAKYGPATRLDGPTGFFADAWTDGKREIELIGGGVLTMDDIALRKKMLEEIRRKYNK